MTVKDEWATELAVLEEKVDTLTNNLTTLQGTVGDLSSKVDKLNTTLSGYKSFVGGIMFVLTALWAFFGVVWTFIFDGKVSH